MFEGRVSGSGNWAGEISMPWRVYVCGTKGARVRRKTPVPVPTSRIWAFGGRVGVMVGWRW